MKNLRNTLAILLFLSTMIGTAQVGIGTVTPAATLDVTATSLTGTTVDGLLIPRVSRLRAQSMIGTPTSTVLYVDDISSGSATLTTINVTSVGFYFFNGTVWIPLGSAAASNNWAVTGNAGLSGTTNFLGTTDGVDVAFRRSNAASGKIGATSTSFGVNALTAGVATNNAAFGTNALALSTGADNVAVGNGTLSANTTAIQNTGIGNAALATATGSANTAVGFQASNLNGSAVNNVAVGFQALRANTVNNNTGIGFQALAANTTGGSNTGIGFQSLWNNSTGGANTALGSQAGFLLNGSRNTSVGYQALSAAALNENTAVGNFALGRNTGSGNTAMGHEVEFGGSFFNNTTAIGWHALFNNTADNNTAIGYNSLQQNGGATGNTALGASTLRINTGSSNTAIGHWAGDEHILGGNNTYVGFEAGRYSSGLNSTNDNAFFGSQAGAFSSGSFNIAIGSNALKANAATSNNVAIGYNALTANAGTGNVAVGYSAGSAEAGSNKLYISNSATTATTSLIYGEFLPTKILRTNSIFQIGDPAGTGYVFPAARGTVNQVLQTSALGVLSWVNPSALSVTETDPQVTSTATNAVPRWNGTTLVDGVIIDDATNVGIGGAPTTGNRLDVTGKTKTTSLQTTNLQMTSGATNGYILQSDAAGNGTWAANPSTTLSMVRATLSGPQTLTFPPAASWQKINFNTETFDTGNEFDTATSRFTATKAGFYRVQASYHTNNQNNTNLYSIAVMVNGAYYQMTAHDHSNSGNVERSVSCLVQLAVGGYIEIQAENFVSGVDIDGYSAKTTLEIEQIR